VGFVLDRVASRCSIIPPWLSIPISPGVSALCPLVAAVQRQDIIPSTGATTARLSLQWRSVFSLRNRLNSHIFRRTSASNRKAFFSCFVLLPTFYVQIFSTFLVYRRELEVETKQHFETVTLYNAYSQRTLRRLFPIDLDYIKIQRTKSGHGRIFPWNYLSYNSRYQSVLPSFAYGRRVCSLKQLTGTAGTCWSLRSRSCKNVRD
jgi:hypothetical protein